MITRRNFLQVAAATAAVTGLGGRLGRAAAQQAIGQEQLLRFAPKGQLTILHMADSHAQLQAALLPRAVAEPRRRRGQGQAAPHHRRRAAQRLQHRGASPNAYMLSSDDYEALAKTYGRVGGMDRMATLVKAIRAERGPERVLLLDGGDALQGSYTALATKGGDMVAVLQELGVEATTGHWEFTLGARRIAELFGGIGPSGLVGPGVPRRQRARHRLRGAGVPVARAVREGRRRRRGDRPGIPLHADRQPALDDAQLVVRHPRGGAAPIGGEPRAGRARRWWCCSPTTASTSTPSSPPRVEGIDVILTAHTHDALPQPMRVGNTLLVASGSHGKFLSRLDMEVDGGRVKDVSYGLIPVLADAIAPDPGHARADRGHPRPARGHAGDRAGPHRRAALPPRHLRRHARRPHLRCAARRSATPRSRSRPASAGAAR